MKTNQMDYLTQQNLLYFFEAGIYTDSNQSTKLLMKISFIFFNKQNF